MLNTPSIFFFFKESAGINSFNRHDHPYEVDFMVPILQMRTIKACGCDGIIRIHTKSKGVEPERNPGNLVPASP